MRGTLVIDIMEPFKNKCEANSDNVKKKKKKKKIIRHKNKTIN